jgi:flagellar biosynthesis/type III secretory pathway chaperone
LPAADGAAGTQPAGRPSVDELGALLAQTEEVARQMLSSLSEIQAALASANSADLVRVLEKESAILARLEACAPPRGSSAARAGDGDVPAGIEDLLRHAEPQGGPLHQRWQSLRATLQQCNTLNRANGVAVAVIEQRVRLAISLLRQGSAAPVAYGPAGVTLRTDVRRRVTRA